MNRQISALLTSLDSKKRDFFEFVARELQELQDCGKIKEVLILFYYLLFKLSFSFEIWCFLVQNRNFSLCRFCGLENFCKLHAEYFHAN